ncbi:MAG: tetratricopeptide repeat protein [Phycisphaeraceae bacterium]|nr:tetratricopeptide repeat protein [Phycisphaeraceae bacterium]
MWRPTRSIGPQAQLREIAQKQRATPDPMAAGWIPEDPTLLRRWEPIAEADRSIALLPLAAVLPTLASEAPEAGSDPGQLTPEQMRVYVRARQANLRDDSAEAGRELESLARAAPGAGAVWRELGLARARLNITAGSADAFRTAHRLGAPSAQGAYVIGKQSAGKGDHREAAAYLASAIMNGQARSDQAMQFLLLASLGAELRSIGYLRSGNDAFELALRTPRQFATTTALQADLTDFARRIPSMWVDVGDTWVRLGEIERAMSAFDQSAATGLAFGSQPVVRMASLQMRQGRSAGAAMLLLDALDDPRFTLDDRLVMLSRSLFRAHTRVSELIGPSIDRLRTAQGRPPSVDAWLARARAASSDPSVARRTLMVALRSHPHVSDLIDDLVTSAETPASAVGACRELIKSDALFAGQCAGALLDRRGRHDAVWAAVSHDSSREARLLEAYLSLLNEDPESALSALAGIDESEIFDPGFMMARVEVFAAMGDWSAAEASLARLDATRGQRWVLARSRALQAMNRLSDASRVLESQPTPAGGEVGRMASQLASVAAARGDQALARTALETSLAHDPAREDALQALLSIDAGNPQAERALAERLRSEAPAGRLIRRLAIQELLAVGQRAQAEQRLIALATERPSPGPTLELLLGLWEGSAALDGGVSLDRGLNWIEAQLAERPDQIELIRARARLLVAKGKVDQAEQMVLERLAQRDSPLLRRAHEQIVRLIPGRAAEAQSMAQARLDRFPDAIPGILERLAAALRRADVATAGRESRRWPVRAELMAQHQPAVIDAMSAAGASVAREPEGSDRAPFLEVVSWALRAGATLPPTIHQLRLGLLAVDSPADVTAIVGATGLAIQQQPEAVEGLSVAAPRYLATVNRFGEALEVIDRINDLHPLEQSGLELWVRLIASGGGALHARQLIDSGLSPEDLRAVVDRVFGPSDSVSDAPESVYGQAVFQLANAAAFFGREQDSMELNEYALELDPNNAWAANNLGYSLADRGERLDEAERLLEFAHAALPEEASVMDSLAWARYRVGAIHDTPASGGQAARPGAVSLLRKAIELAGDSPSAEMLDHFGDALWLAGDRQAASDAWRRALERADADRAKLTDASPQHLRDGLDADIAAIRGKLEDSASGREPAVAAIVQDAPA